MRQATASATFIVFGVEVKCHVLDDGQRIIEADSAKALFEAMGNPASGLPDDLESLRRWLSGLGYTCPDCGQWFVLWRNLWKHRQRPDLCAKQRDLQAGVGTEAAQ